MTQHSRRTGVRSRCAQWPRATRFDPLAPEMPGEIALRRLDGVLLLRQQPVVGDRRELARPMAERGEGPDTPIQPGDGFAPFAVRLALDHQRQEPAIRFALEVAADHPTGRSGLATRPHAADAGQAQLAVPPALAGLELEAVAMRLETKTGEAIPALEPREARRLPCLLPAEEVPEGQ